MGRPKKIATARRNDQIVVYVHKIVGDALRREAEVKGISLSTLAADILSEWVSSGGMTVSISQDTLYAVMKRLAVEGLLKDEVLSEASKCPKDADAKMPADTEASNNEPAVESGEDVTSRGEGGIKR